MNCDTVEQIKADCGVNVLDILDPQSDLAKEVATFPPVIGKLLFAAIGDQAKTAGVDDREFRRSMNGETLNQAHDALLEEIVLFSPKHRQKVAAAVLEKNREVQQAAEELALARLADPELKGQVMEALEASLRTEMEAVLKRLGATQRVPGREQEHTSPDAPAREVSETGSSPVAGMRQDSWDSLGPALTPGDN